ncbi:MAG: efflux RND transporter periplasmic adaptor subunit [Xanthobacteraceae bacterium]|nr:efflux RND transporter periplasmic adaptor subunit [Xanthobacteraceae bacterium]
MATAPPKPSWQRVEIAIPMDDQGIRAAGIATIHVEPDQGRADLSFPGTVTIPQHQLRIVAAPAGGLVETMLVAPDEPVTIGQPVAQVRSPELVEAQKNYLGALSDEALTSDKLRRAQLLFEGKALPERELRVAESESSSAKSRLDERMQILFLMGIDKDDFETLRTTHTIVSALVVKSPVNGTVVSRHASAGEQVKSAAPLYTFGELDPLWVNIQIPAPRLATIEVGASVMLPAYGIEGRIIRIGRTVDQSTQSAIAVAEVNASDGRLRPGLALTANVRIQNGDVAGASKNWSVPSSSVVRHRDQSWVFMRSAEGFRAKPVQVINESARSVAIRADLRSSDEVASRGVLALLSELVDADKED